MPITKSAKKALRASRKKRIYNLRTKKKLKKISSSFKKKPTQKTLGELTSAVDKAVKKNIFGKTKASRMKSKFSAYLNKKLPENTIKKPKNSKKQ